MANKQINQDSNSDLSDFKAPTFFFFWYILYSMWDLSLPTRDGILAPCIGSMESTTGPPGKSLKTHTFNHYVIPSPESSKSIGEMFI